MACRGRVGWVFIGVVVDWFSWLPANAVANLVGVLASLFGVFLSFTALSALLYLVTRLRVVKRASARPLSYWLTVLLQRPVRIRLVARALEAVSVLLSMLPLFAVIYYSKFTEYLFRSLYLSCPRFRTGYLISSYSQACSREDTPTREPRDSEMWVRGVVEGVFVSVVALRIPRF